MADRPILFSGPMVRALLAGTKTQTRRVLKGSALAAREPQWEAKKGADGVWRLLAGTPDLSGSVVPDIRIAIGDRLYVREAWRCNGWATDVATVMYRASEGDGYTAMTEQYPVEGKSPMRVTGTWRPGIHMPRWASRLTLTVTDVRVERLQDCSNEDALAEGVVPVVHRVGGTTRYSATGDKFGLAQRTPKLAYAHLWDSINGEDAWSENPWVAAYTFTVQKGNIDAQA